MGDIVQVFGIDGNLSKERPVSFEVSEAFFALLFFTPFSGQSVVFEDSGDGLMGTGQVVFLLESLGAHKGELFSEPDDFPFECDGDFMGAGQGYSGQFIQSGQSFLLIALQPFADGFWGGMEGACGGFDAVLFCILNHSES